MELIAGVDGCKGGWVAACAPAENLAGHAVHICSSFKDLPELVPPPGIIVIDIPLGLSHGPPRECDKMARKLLGFPRGSSVFPAPLRPAIHARTYKEAHCITQKHHPRGKGISRQSFGIFAKVREADEIMTPGLQERVMETHPEVVFYALNRGRPMARSKKTREGLEERIRLLEAFLPRVREEVEKRRGVRDDLVDAFAALVTAHFYRRGSFRSLPDLPEKDPRGLRMEIICPLAQG